MPRRSHAPLKFKSSENSKEDLKTNQTNKTFIVKNFSEPLRNNPNPNAQIKNKVKLGTVLNASQKNADWYLVGQSDELKGWISARAVDAFDEISAEKIYLQIAEESYRQDMNFEKASELADFLNRAIRETKTTTTKARLEFLRLLTVKQALKAFPLDKRESSPYSDFLRVNKEIIIYNQPNAEWIITSKAFWDLQRKYSSLPIAEEIAWEASQNPLPGECGSDLVCMIFYVRMTKAEYLRLYPDGRKSVEALEEMADLLEKIFNNSKASFYDQKDSSYKTEFFELIVELEKIVARSNSAKKEKVLQQLKKISERFTMAN
ncbi:MAG: SH3 domain-containing protein [Pyrinomonadaceae bacterium]